jgi:hypothetical protein
MPVINHIHSYVRFSASQMKCADPYCSHLQTKERLLGKVSRCPICKTTDFILTRADLRLAKPRCINCSNTKEAREFKENRDKVKETLKNALDNVSTMLGNLNEGRENHE